MNVLIFSHVQRWISHHAESIELTLNHKSKGDNVFFLSCVGVLKGCPSNPFRVEKLCGECVKQTEYTERYILDSEVEHIHLNYQNKQRDYYGIDTVQKLIAYELYGVPFGWMVFCSIAAEINDGFLEYKEHKDRIHELLDNGISLYEESKNIIEKNNIDLVYVWNGRRSCDGPITYAAEHLGKEYRTFISGASINSYDIRPTHYMNDLIYIKRKIADMSETVLASADMHKFFSSSTRYFDFSRGDVVDGFNHLGFYQFSKKFKQNIPIPEKKDKEVLVIYAGTFTEFFGMPEYTRDNDIYSNFYDAVRDITNIPGIDEKYDIYVRWHPNSRALKGYERKVLEMTISECSHNAYHYPPESAIDSYKLMDIADLVISIGTSMAVEACYYRKPSIFIGNNIFEDLDCFYKPKNKEELYDLLLNKKLKEKSFMDALKYGFYRANRGEYRFKYIKQYRQGELFCNNRNIQYRTFSKVLKEKIKKAIRLFSLRILHRVGM